MRTNASLASVSSRLVVLKIGGSVLTGFDAFREVAGFVADSRRQRPHERLLVVVSAEYGTTDALLATALRMTPNPDAGALDLLWSTGELRSVALLVLALQASGIRAAAANVHQTGLLAGEREGSGAELKPLRLRALLASCDVVVLPGFLARGAGDSIVSLGRGGSDLTAVLLATALSAERCELIKDVPGYFSQDPNQSTDARPLPWLTYLEALELAEHGCQLVQRQALEAARDHALPLLVRAIAGQTSTLVGVAPDHAARAVTACSA